MPGLSQVGKLSLWGNTWISLRLRPHNGGSEEVQLCGIWENSIDWRHNLHTSTRTIQSGRL